MKKSSYDIEKEKDERYKKVFNQYCVDHPIFNIVSKHYTATAIPAFFILGFIELILTETYGLFTVIGTAIVYFLSKYIYRSGTEEIDKLL